MTTNQQTTSPWLFLPPPPTQLAPYPPHPDLLLGDHQVCSISPHPALLPGDKMVFPSVIHELHFACSWITLNKDPTVWLDGAKPANTCIPLPSPSMTTAQVHGIPTTQSCFPLTLLWLLGYAMQCVGNIQEKKGRTQVLAGLAPSSQTVGSNIRVIHEQARCSSWMTEVNLSPVTKQQNWVRGKWS